MIRQAFKKDYPAIYQFVKSAFETGIVSDGLELDYLEYLRTIPENDNQYEYVAEQDHQIIGHVKLNITFIGKDTVFLLAPLAVHKDYRNQKIVTQLMQHAIQEAKKTTIGAIFLIGDIHYYGRFGFVHSHILSTPQTSFLLELPLQQKKYQGMLKIYEMPKTIVIDGENIFSLDDFYHEIEIIFTKELIFKMGHNAQ